MRQDPTWRGFPLARASVITSDVCAFAEHWVGLLDHQSYDASVGPTTLEQEGVAVKHTEVGGNLRVVDHPPFHV